MAAAAYEGEDRDDAAGIALKAEVQTGSCIPLERAVGTQVAREDVCAGGLEEAEDQTDSRSHLRPWCFSYRRKRRLQGHHIGVRTEGGAWVGAPGDQPERAQFALLPHELERALLLLLARVASGRLFLRRPLLCGGPTIRPYFGSVFPSAELSSSDRCWIVLSWSALSVLPLLLQRALPAA